MSVVEILLTLALVAPGLPPLAAAQQTPPPDAGERRRVELDEVARVASVMVDGDLCRRIMTPRALERMRTPDPRDQWSAGDNFDVHHEPYIRTKKTLMRLARLVSYPCDVNLWMPFQDRPDRIQILIRNAHELSQFWPWGALDQPMIPEMKQVLENGARVTVRRKPGMISVLAPVRDSLGDIVGLVEVVAEVPGAKRQPVHAD